MKTVLLAEDDLDDQEIFQEAIASLDSRVKLHIAENGEKLISFLQKLSDADLPDLIVLDQNMPRLKGKDTVEELRKFSRYNSIPAVIYSTYHDPKFMQECEQLNIELLLKPDTFDGFSDMIKALIHRYIR